MIKEIDCWKNGEWIPASKLSIETWDAHYFFGWAVFDAFRTYNHKLHLLDCHLDRLYKSASLTGIEIKYSKKELKNIINDVMEHNKEFFKDDEYRFMIFATPGKFKIFDDIGDTKPNISIQLTTLSRYAKYIFPILDKGNTSLIVNQLQIPSRFLDVKIKSCSRLHYGLADIECEEYGKDVIPIILDENGFICESSGSNICFMKDNTVHIPTGVDMLRGCTIKFMEDILKESDIDIVKDKCQPYDLIDCNGILFTSTYSGITPSYKLIYKGKKYNLINNNLYQKILDIVSKKVEVNVREQWRRWYEE